MGKVYVTGDCHADFSKFTTWSFPEQKGLTKDDVIIVLGDFGLWNDCKEERYELDWLSEKSFTIAFVDGNHENFDRLYSDEFEIVDFYGGKAQKIRDNIFHLLRGNVYDIGGKKFFAFGGASSHDICDGILEPEDFSSRKELMKEYRRLSGMGKLLRINHLSWWKEELPNEEELKFGIENLNKVGNKVDYIISHCCPQSVASLFSRGLYEKDKLTEYFDTIAESTTFEKWFCGHYHIEDEILNKYVILYSSIKRIV